MKPYHVHVYSDNSMRGRFNKTIGEVIEEFLNGYNIEKCELRYIKPKIIDDAPWASINGILHPQLGNYSVTFIGCYCKDDLEKGEPPL